MVEERLWWEERLGGEPESADGWTGCLGNDCFPHSKSSFSVCFTSFLVLRLKKTDLP